LCYCGLRYVTVFTYLFVISTRCRPIRECVFNSAPR